MQGKKRNYLHLQWGVLVPFLLVLDLTWILFSHLEVRYESITSLYLGLVLLALYLPYLYYKYVRHEEQASVAFLSILYFLVFGMLMALLSYLVTTAARPLCDGIYVTIDTWFGYDTLQLNQWVKEHPLWDHILSFSYATYYFQMPVIILYFSFFRKFVELQRFLIYYSFAALLTILLFGLFPAEGPPYWFHYSSPDFVVSAHEQMMELRDQILDLRRKNGIVLFPSFHAAMAMIYIYTMREENKLIFLPFLLLNAIMIVSCLSHGHHYLVDIIGSVFVVIVSLGLEKLIFRKNL